MRVITKRVPLSMKNAPNVFSYVEDGSQVQYFMRGTTYSYTY